MKKIYKLFPVLFAALIVFLTACGLRGGEEATDASGDTTTAFVLPEGAEEPLATIEIEDGRKILAVLLPEDAPNTVYNFISLANSGFYDGLTFHRASADLLIQGGDPNGNGTGNPGYAIRGEFSANGVNNELKHLRGTLSMARSQQNDSAGCQFFIVAASSAAGWDGKYAAFGRVIEGMEYVDEISRGALSDSESGALVEPVKIKTIRVETNNVPYPEPKTLKR